MSAKSLIRYRSTVGGDDPLSSSSAPGWPSDKDSVKKSAMREVGSVSEPSSNNRLEEDSFDEGIDDILAQVRVSAHVKESLGSVLLFFHHSTGLLPRARKLLIEPGHYF